MILIQSGEKDAAIGVPVVDDSTIARLHGEFLDDPTPTDVLSFVLENSPDRLEGEIAVSADTARSSAESYDWPPENELLLYVIHGTLHLVGYDDITPKKRKIMRQKEQEFLTALNVTIPRSSLILKKPKQSR
jgi:probable rRNA maturation factor